MDTGTTSLTGFSSTGKEAFKLTFNGSGMPCEARYGEHVWASKDGKNWVNQKTQITFAGTAEISDKGNLIFHSADVPHLMAVRFDNRNWDGC